MSPSKFLNSLEKRAAASEESAFVFNCYIIGEPRTFTVSATGSTTVEQLIELINQRGQIDRLGSDILRRTVYWKVCQKCHALLDG
jgi:hypothetical protein